MPRKLVIYLAFFLLLGVSARLLLSLESPAVMGVNWATSLAGGTPTPAPPSQETPLPVAASVQAFYQGDPRIGWDSRTQYTTWWPSACSPAALTMVLRAWGTNTSIGAVLDHLIAHKAITPQSGLLNAGALAAVASEYGFQAKTFWHLTAQQVARLTVQGVPVLADVVDAKRQTAYPDFVVGHWLVVVGVSQNQIEVRDSSGYHIRSLSPATFHILFTGISVVVWRGASISLP